MSQQSIVEVHPGQMISPTLGRAGASAGQEACVMAGCAACLPRRFWSGVGPGSENHWCSEASIDTSSTSPQEVCSEADILGPTVSLPPPLRIEILEDMPSSSELVRNNPVVVPVEKVLSLNIGFAWDCAGFKDAPRKKPESPNPTTPPRQFRPNDKLQEPVNCSGVFENLILNLLLGCSLGALKVFMTRYLYRNHKGN